MYPHNLSELVEQGYNHIPVVREVLADLDTPLSTYLKIADGPYSYLLESAQGGGEKWGRYSIVGLPSKRVLKVYGHRIRMEEEGVVVAEEEVDDPLAYVEALRNRYRSPRLPSLPIYTGGLVGYFGYDTVRLVEARLEASQPPETIETPDILLMLSDEVIVFDSLRGRIELITHIDPRVEGAAAAAEARLDDLVIRLEEPVPLRHRRPERGPQIHEEDFVSSFGEQEFMTAVERIKEYIVAGDVMQVVLSQRMSLTVEAEPIDLYRALRILNPSPYMYFMNLGDFHIVSSSPEILARLDGAEIAVRPLAGTRRRGRDEGEDLALEQELLADPKEIAEHLMLIDLGRNDVGRVAEIGSVEVTEMMVIERYSHVMHIASHVRGTLKKGLGAIDLLRATLPVGTLSGAPKIRAMEIIDELEPEKRGIFGGAVGYLAWNGNMDTAIAIRTAVRKGRHLYIQAGAGVVADSVPALEWKETVNKARAIFTAAAMSERGLMEREDFAANPRAFNRDEARPVVSDGGGSRP